MSLRRALGVGLLPPALFAGALLLAALLDPESLRPGSPLALAALGAAATVAALHRPAVGGLLGLGTLALVPLARHTSPFTAAVAVAAASLLSEALRRLLERRRPAPLPERRGFARASSQAALAGIGTLAAVALLAPRAGADDPGGLAAAVALAALGYLAPAALFEAATRRLLRGEDARGIALGLAPLAGELPGLALGGLAVAVEARAGSPLAAALLAGFVLLAAEAARQALGAEAAERTLAESARVSRASRSLAAGGSELARLALRIFDECAGIVRYAYVQLELAGAGVADTTRYWADSEGEPREGEADPPPYPPPLPGFHKREPWRIVELDLLAEGDRRARLRLWCDPRRIEPRAEASLAALAPQMGASVRTALLDREATLDRLTGAATRRALERRLVDAFAAASAEARPLALVLCDLDHFKRINDRFGHPAGDRALQAVARVLLAGSRGREMCARYGGEEFVLVLEEAGGEAALEAAERLRRRIEAIELETPGGPVPLSMSFGVAAYPELPVRSPEELLELADGALYTAKRLGRNLALLDLGGGRMRTGAGGLVEVAEPPPGRAPVFFA